MADFSLTFADGADAYIIPALELAVSDSFGDLVPNTARLPMLDGGFDRFGADPAPAEIGRINVSFALTAETREAMQAQIDAVRTLARLGKRKLTWQPQGSANARWCWARVNNIGTPRRPAEHSDLMQRVSITFQASDPHWYEDEDTDEIVATGTSTDGTIAVTGNCPALARVVVFCDTGETAHNPTVRRIVDSETLDEMAYSGIMVADDELIMDAQAKAVTLNAVAAYDAFSFVHADWLRLMPGSNTIRVALGDAGDSCVVDVYWYPTYR